MSLRMWGQVIIQAATPGEDPVVVGTLWIDTSATATLKVCTAVSPYTWVEITGSGGAPAAHATTHMAAGSDPIRLDELKAPTDVTTLDATTSLHGLAPKATAPAAGLLSVLAIGNGETSRTDQALFDTTNPAALGTVGPGTSKIAARRDHIHANVTDASISTTDVTTNDVSSSKHGWAPKGDGTTTKFLNANGAYSTPTGGNHDLLDGAVAQDTVAGTVVRGDIIVGNSTPKWARVAKGAANSVLAGNGTDSAWSTTPTVASITTTGAATIGTSLDISASGAGQITFPATQNASSGANVLDDYEEGSFTPVIGGITSESGQTYTTQVGRYVKKGKEVTISGYVELSAKGTITGNVAIKGLPFTIANITGYFPAGVIGYNIPGVTIPCDTIVEMTPNTSYMTLYVRTITLGAPSNPGPLVTADLSNTAQFEFGGTYVTTN